MSSGAAGTSRKVESNLVGEDVATYWLSGHSAIIKASSCQDDALEDSYFEGKVIKGILLSIKHSSGSKAGQKVYANSMFHVSSSSIAAKRQRIAQTASYDRMMVFGDVMDPPRCFAIVTYSSSESSNYFKHCQHSIAIGQLFYIVEPDKSDKVLSSNMPIISSRKSMIPLKHSAPDLPITESLPVCRMTVPKEPGEQLFFIVHRAIVSLSRFEIMLGTVSCTGYTCDRSKPLDKNVACGCIFTSGRNPIVGEYTLTMPVPSLISERRKEDIQRCRSLRTTQLFFKNLPSYGEQTAQAIEERFQDVREKVKKMVEYVNNKGGWTVVGWFKKGEVSDSSNQAEKVESLTCTLHISLLIPTSASIANGTDSIFEGMRIATDVTAPG